MSGERAHFAGLAHAVRVGVDPERQVAQLQDITQYRVAVFLAREDSLALLRDAYKKWPLLKQVAGPNVFLDVIIDRRES